MTPLVFNTVAIAFKSASSTKQTIMRANQYGLELSEANLQRGHYSSRSIPLPDLD
jgi:hypothetical protein